MQHIQNLYIHVQHVQTFKHIQIYKAQIHSYTHDTNIQNTTIQDLQVCENTHIHIIHKIQTMQPYK